MVAGVAALIKSQYTSMGAAQIKSVIINSADKTAGLYGLCVSGGRLNAYRALQLAEYDTLTNGWTQGGLYGNVGSHYSVNSAYSISTRIRYSTLIDALASTSYTANIPTGFSMGIQEYDEYGVCIYDSGWKTGTLTFTTNSNTSYFGLVARRTNDASLSPIDLPQIGLFETNPLTSWVQGGVLGGIGNHYATNVYSTTTRIRSGLIPVLKYYTYTLVIPAGFSAGVQQHDIGNICRSDTGWRTGSITILASWDTTSFGIAVRRTNDASITPAQAPQVQLQLTTASSWSQGGIWGHVGNSYSTNSNYTTETRVRQTELIPLLANQTYTVYVPTGFHIDLHEYDSNQICVLSTGWQTGMLTFTTTANTTHLGLALRRTNQQTITPMQAAALRIMLW